MVRRLARLVALTSAAALLASVALVANSSEPELPPSLTPYLQNPAADGMTVCFVAQRASDVHVASGAADATTLRETAARGSAIAGTPWTVWKARLAGLQPGKRYQYQVRYRLDGRPQSAPVYRFVTPDPQSTSVRAALFNDLHDRVGTLDALLKHVKPDDYEFSALLGDCWTDPSDRQGAEHAFRLLESYAVRLNAAEKPMLFVRGNHETRGNFADRLGCLFDLPELDPAASLGGQAFYFTLPYGPVWFLALDCGDDFEKRLEIFQPYRQREAGWLTAVRTRKEGAAAPWRVLLCHMPLYNDNIWTSEPSRRLWEPILADMQIDLSLAGHDHGHKFLPAGTTYSIVGDNAPDKAYVKTIGPNARWSFTTPYPVLIGGGPATSGMEEGTVMLLRADRQSLTVRLLGANQGDLLVEKRFLKAK